MISDMTDEFSVAITSAYEFHELPQTQNTHYATALGRDGRDVSIWQTRQGMSGNSTRTVVTIPWDRPGLVTNYSFECGAKPDYGFVTRNEIRPDGRIIYRATGVQELAGLADYLSVDLTRQQPVSNIMNKTN